MIILLKILNSLKVNFKEDLGWVVVFFFRITNAVEAHNPYFKQRTNALGVLGLSYLQKVIAAHIILAYGIPADLTDEYLRIGETTAIESLKTFVKAMVEIFGDWYLRAPNEADIC